MKFENCVKDKNDFFIKWKIAFLCWTKIFFILGAIILKDSWEFNYLSVFFAEADTEKHRYASAKVPNAALVKITDWIIKNDHVINYPMFFCKWFVHDQTSNVIWLSTTWLLIFGLEVVNKKPLFTAKPASIWIEISC